MNAAKYINHSLLIEDVIKGEVPLDEALSIADSLHATGQSDFRDQLQQELQQRSASSTDTDTKDHLNTLLAEVQEEAFDLG